MPSSADRDARRISRWRFAAIGSLAVFAVESCRAFEQASSDPAVVPSLAETAKLLTEDAFTVSPGNLEVEAGYRVAGVRQSFDSERDPVDRQTSIGQYVGLQATYGVSPTVDARIGVAWFELVRNDTGEPSDTHGNVTTGVKWTFLSREDGRVALAWVPGFTAPYGVDSNDTTVSVGQDFYSFDNLLAFTYVTQRWNVSVDTGYSLPIGHRRGSQHGIFVADAGVGYQLEPWIQPVLEASYSHGLVVGAGGDSDLLALGVGAVSNVSNTVRIDAGLLQGVFGRNTDSVTALVLNVSVTF